MGLYKLSKVEKDVLYRKWTLVGLCSEQANERLKKINDQLENLVLKLREKGKTKDQINKKFKEEFAKLCSQPVKTRKRGSFTKNRR
jgi:hypothetical protein